MRDETADEVAAETTAPSTAAAVCIFDPTPIVTVTVEPADSGDEIHFHAGGQGVWIARMVRRLDRAATLVSPCGGETGILLPQLLEAEEISLVATHMAHDNGAYVQDRRTGSRERIAESIAPALSRHESDDLFGSMLAAAAEADVVALAAPRSPGAVPDDFYARLCADIATLDKPVVADLSGGALESALSGGVYVLKVSEEDLLRDGFQAGTDHQDRVDALTKLHELGATAVVLTRSDRPSMAYVEGRMVAICGPALTPVDHRGAGDAMTAAIAVQLSAGSTLADALRWGAAAGAASVTRRGLASGRSDEIGALVEYVDIRPIEAAMD